MLRDERRADLCGLFSAPLRLLLDLRQQAGVILLAFKKILARLKTLFKWLNDTTFFIAESYALSRNKTPPESVIQDSGGVCLLFRCKIHYQIGVMVSLM